MKTLEDIPEKERKQIKALVRKEAPDFYEALLFEMMCLAYWNETKITAKYEKVPFYALDTEDQTNIRMLVMELVRETRAGMTRGIIQSLVEDYFNASETPNTKPPSKANGNSGGAR